MIPQNPIEPSAGFGSPGGSDGPSVKSLGVPRQREQFDPIQQHYDPGATLVSVSNDGNVRHHICRVVDVAGIACDVIIRIEDLNLVHGPAQRSLRRSNAQHFQMFRS